MLLKVILFFFLSLTELSEIFFIYIVNWPNDCLFSLKDSLNDFSLELSRADKLPAFYIAPHAWVDFSEEGNWSTQRKSSSQVDFDQKF